MLKYEYIKARYQGDVMKMDDTSPPPHNVNNPPAFPERISWVGWSQSQQTLGRCGVHPNIKINISMNLTHGDMRRTSTFHKEKPLTMRDSNQEPSRYEVTLLKSSQNIPDMVAATSEWHIQSKSLCSSDLRVEPWHWGYANLNRLTKCETYNSVLKFMNLWAVSEDIL